MTQSRIILDELSPDSPVTTGLPDTGPLAAPGQPKPMQVRPSRAYKDVTLQQLRSFCETVRLGSLTAAADSLGIARPTVWRQVHALEHHLGMQLVEPHARGCQPTEAGRSLAEIAGPLVTGIALLKPTLQMSNSSKETVLKVAAAQRLLIDDLPPCVAECERRFPHIRLVLNEMRADDVATAVASRQSDLGLAAIAADPEDPWVSYEPCYELDIMLVTPRDHPLARRRRVQAIDLGKFPLVNSPKAFANDELNAALQRFGLFKAQPRRVEAQSAATIRRYVAMGYGIGLITVSPMHQPDPELHERPMTADLGRLTVYAIRRKGALLPDPSREFVSIVKQVLECPPGAR